MNLRGTGVRRFVPRCFLHSVGNLPGTGPAFFPPIGTNSAGGIFSILLDGG